MSNSISSFRRFRYTLLLLLLPLVGELLFIEAVINDPYTRKRIRVVFSLLLFSSIALIFSVTEFLSVVFGSWKVPLPSSVAYAVIGLVSLMAFLLFCMEGWSGGISLEEEIAGKNHISLSVHDDRAVFITLNRILDAAQLLRFRYASYDNSHLAHYALTLLGEFLHRKFAPSKEPVSPSL